MIVRTARLQVAIDEAAAALHGGRGRLAAG